LPLVQHKTNYYRALLGSASQTLIKPKEAETMEAQDIQVGKTYKMDCCGVPRNFKVERVAGLLVWGKRETATGWINTWAFCESLY
jgi:hypothetical protein